MAGINTNDSVNDNSRKKPSQKRLKNSDYRDREYLYISEVNKLLGASKREKNGEMWHCLLLLIFRHALRLNEALSLKWTDINWRDARISITRLKGSLDGVHPLDKDEIKALKTLYNHKKSTYIFISSHGKPLSDVAVRKFFTKVGNKVGFEFPIHPHMMRHSAAIAYLYSTNNLYLTQQFLGHRDIENTLVYLKLVPGKLESVGEWYK